MNKLRPAFFAFFVTISLTNCNQQANQDIQDCFLRIQTAAQSFDSEAVLAQLDSESLEYFKTISELAKEKSNYKINEFCDAHPDYSLMTRLLIGAVSNIADSTSAEPKNALLANMILGTGVLSSLNNTQVTFAKVEKIRSGKATVIVNQKINTNAFIQSKYFFTKENDAWKLNVFSTYSLFEKYLDKEWRRIGGDVNFFIKTYLEKGGSGQMMLKYRK